MNWRHKLADWISGGELTDAYKLARSQQEHLSAMERNLFTCRDSLFKYGLSLQKIADMETPKCASIGRRMAAVAREALNNGA